jgi:hypothetical protein
MIVIERASGNEYWERTVGTSSGKRTVESWNDVLACGPTPPMSDYDTQALRSMRSASPCRAKNNGTYSGLTVRLRLERPVQQQLRRSNRD